MGHIHTGPVEIVLLALGTIVVVKTGQMAAAWIGSKNPSFGSALGGFFNLGVH